MELGSTNIMALSLRTVINSDVTFNTLGQVKSVQRGTTTINNAQQTVLFSTVSSTQKIYIIATFKADTVYSLAGFTTEVNTNQSFVFDGGGQGGVLSWQVVEVY